MTAGRIEAQCCIAGGGPAGMVLGLLLARAGVEVVVLEKHGDFLRDFRGDTIHPSTLEVMHELGLLDDLLKLPHTRVERMAGQIGSESWPIADMRRLPTRCKFIAIMPQWDFLDFLARSAARYPGFRLRMLAKAKALAEEGGRVVGVKAQTADGRLEVRARLVVGADGRHSTIRQAAGLVPEEIGAPMDVLWFKLSRRAGDPPETFGRFAEGRIMALIDRGEHWQLGFVIPKGSIEALHASGLPAFREEVGRMAPFARDRLDEIRSWDDVRPLTVRVDRLRQWHRPGLLCIGDAAHAMSPVGGIGINLAIQDAVATANLLADKLRENRLADDDLALVQARRDFPTRMTQRFQVFVQRNVISNVLSSKTEIAPPVPLRLFKAIPWLQRFPARLIGMGIRPEHVEVAEAR